MYASIASKCEFSYGFSGKVGFLYESMKDQIRWKKLRVKNHIGTISSIGKIMSLSDEDYNKGLSKTLQMAEDELANALKIAFGDCT